MEGNEDRSISGPSVVEKMKAMAAWSLRWRRCRRRQSVSAVEKMKETTTRMSRVRSPRWSDGSSVSAVEKMKATTVIMSRVRPPRALRVR